MIEGGGRAIVETPLEEGLYIRKPRYDIGSGKLRVRITAEVSEQLLNREKPIRVRLLKNYSTDILKVRLENVSLRYYPALGVMHTIGDLNTPQKANNT